MASANAAAARGGRPARQRGRQASEHQRAGGRRQAAWAWPGAGPAGPSASDNSYHYNSYCYNSYYYNSYHCNSYCYNRCAAARLRAGKGIEVVVLGLSRLLGLPRQACTAVTSSCADQSTQSPAGKSPFGSRSQACRVTRTDIPKPYMQRHHEDSSLQRARTGGNSDGEQESQLATVAKEASWRNTAVPWPGNRRPSAARPSIHTTVCLTNAAMQGAGPARKPGNEVGTRIIA